MGRVDVNKVVLNVLSKDHCKHLLEWVLFIGILTASFVHWGCTLVWCFCLESLVVQASTRWIDQGFPWSSHTSDLEVGGVVATVPGVTRSKHYRAIKTTVVVLA